MCELEYDYSNMSKEELVVLYEEMKGRVQLFMEECTNMSKTNYSNDVLKVLISDKKEQDIKEWCWMTVEDGKLTDDYVGYIVKEVEENGKESE